MSPTRSPRSLEAPPRPTELQETLHAPPPIAARDAWVVDEGEPAYRIAGYDRLAPFLIHLPTDTDLWMFISSAGGLTAGRRDPDGALFPYETVDRLHEGHHHTGPLTLVRVHRPGRTPYLWEPFAGAGDERERALIRNATGNRLVFEESHAALGLTFRAAWAGSDATGWVRTATLTNHNRESAVVSVLDGLRNLLPAGVPLGLQQRSSCLVDAYKRADAEPDAVLGIYSLTSRVSDRPEPSEELHATVAWCHGLPDPVIALSSDAADAFRRGEPMVAERAVGGRRGHFFASATFVLEPGARLCWRLAADTGLGHVRIAALRARLRERAGVERWVGTALREAGDHLRQIVASADGLQLTSRPEVHVHHFANVLFNGLRGGVFADGHAVSAHDFTAFVTARHRGVAARQAAWFATLPARLEVSDLHARAAATGDPDLRRLAFEYLPLFFGRRHGDPSRPWNRFTIRVREPDGRRALHYEGNWRDVFQNWEALAYAFPGFLPGLVAKFVNASTLDGFNPYRIGRDGVDWETPDPSDPWSGIGYWGDHQIVYLLRLLEATRHFHPGALETLLGEALFSAADVPYRIAPYPALLANPRATITYDAEHARLAAARVAAIGQDGRLVAAADGAVHRATLLEKLIVPALAKMSSLVPDGGVWMNTERPEWNDANNALVGGGLSVVTACHLRRYLRFLGALLEAAPGGTAMVDAHVVEWLRAVRTVLERHAPGLAEPRVDDRTRRTVMDAVGGAFSTYRERLYATGPGAPTALAFAEVGEACAVAVRWLDHTIRANRREDGLYHAYNLLEADPSGETASVQSLDLMLEGQVAALSSGLVTPEEAVALLERLAASPLYRADQDTFLLYPERTLPPFMERNRVPDAQAAAVPLIGALLEAGEPSLVARDADGVVRFHAGFTHARDVAAALDRLASDAAWRAAVARDRAAVLSLYEQVFEHRTYTGRSGRMYAFEGLGSIYWHMVAKLLLAVQEVALSAHDDGAPLAVREALARAYHRIRGGLGYEKSAAEFGAFPTDPYSHTPRHAGAQQPGMTGQVKEEILTRLGELGVRVEDGIVRFAPVLLRATEFLPQPTTFLTLDGAGQPCGVGLPARSLAFTVTQVPVVYTLADGAPWLRVTHENGHVEERSGATLTATESRALLARRGGIARIDVGVPASWVLDPRSEDAPPCPF